MEAKKAEGPAGCCPTEPRGSVKVLSGGSIEDTNKTPDVLRRTNEYNVEGFLASPIGMICCINFVLFVWLDNFVSCRDLNAPDTMDDWRGLLRDVQDGLASACAKWMVF